MRAYSHGLDVLGSARVVFGAFDLGVIQHALDRIKPMSVAQAKVLVSYGQKVIDAAIKAADAAPRTSPLWTVALGPLASYAMSSGPLPGDASRQNVKWKLAWHQDALSKLFSPQAPYGAADDLKTWVRQAYIEWNASEEGSKYAQANFDAMLDEVMNRTLKVLEAPGKIMDKVTEMPWWGWAIIGTVGLGVVGGTMLAWKKLRS